MVKVLFLLLFVIVQHDAQAIDPVYPPLFASAIDVEKGDVLNVRAKPSHKSTKVADIPSTYDFPFTFGVEKCTSVKSSIWCRVYPIAQHWSENFGGDVAGWVNARYLRFSNRGYVIVNGRKNCDYALSCHNNKCEVVYDLIAEDQNRVKKIKTKWVERKYLKGESNFGVTPDNVDGYCNSRMYIEDCIARENIKKLSQYNSGLTYDTAMKVAQSLRDPAVGEKLQAYIHPIKGVVVTWNVLFGGKEDKVFSKQDILEVRDWHKDKIHWGHTYGKGDAVVMNLANHLKMFARPIRNITKVEKLKELKGFMQSDNNQRVGYEVFWINEESETKEYDYLGLVVMLEKYQDKWYVVGLLRDRWTI